MSDDDCFRNLWRFYRDFRATRTLGIRAHQGSPLSPPWRMAECQRVAGNYWAMVLLGKGICDRGEGSGSQRQVEYVIRPPALRIFCE